MDIIIIVGVVLLIVWIYNAGYKGGKREGSRKGFGVGFDRGRRSKGGQGCLVVLMVGVLLILFSAVAIARTLL